MSVWWLAVSFVVAAMRVPVSSQSEPVPLRMESPIAVVDRYEERLAELRAPKSVSFEYTVEQAGRRSIEQTHRVYRDAHNERDETISVDGQRLVPPSVRIFRRRSDRYRIELLAPRRAQYAFAFVETRKAGKHLDYVYRTVPRKAAAFWVESVTIDGIAYLPRVLTFSTFANNVRGSGTVAFVKVGRHWVASVATATANVGGNVARERLTFSAYRFPSSLPRSTFSEAKPLPSALPPAPSLSGSR